MSRPSDIVIVDVEDSATFGRLPPCADPRFDHRSCDYWEDAVRGSKAARPAWWREDAAVPEPPPRRTDNPFAPASSAGFNPFAPASREPADNPFAPPRAGRSAAGTADPFAPLEADPFAAHDDPLATGSNPFAPAVSSAPRLAADAPRKLRLLDRGHAVFGSYAMILLLAGEPAAYSQFGPLSAYPRAQRIRELYPRLPQSPLPAVITCIATTAEVRHRGLARRLVEAVCVDLGGRGFSAVEAYPDLTLASDEASAATPAFWRRCGFAVAADDARYPVLRRDLV